MGALGDITAKASNIKRPSSSSSSRYKSMTPLGEQENLGSSKSPHFMTPTFASKQSTTPTTTPSTLPLDRPSTPISVNGEQSHGNAFLKRVGLRRLAEAPRSSKEAFSNNKGFSFPDKLANPSYSKLPASPPSAQKTEVFPRDKPLPSPPDQYINTSPMKAKITLIDASERPLRRSPTGMGDTEEDWPTLQPKRVVSTSSIQEVLRNTGSALKRQASTIQAERYPKLKDTSQQPVSDDQLPVSAYSPLSTILCAESSSHSLTNAEESAPGSNPTKNFDVANAEAKDPFRDESHPTESFDEPKELLKPSQLSASAAALEKATVQSFTEVRQTRTSSLRARLYAGELVKDDTTELVGFTDCTVESSSDLAQRNGDRERKEAHERRLSFPPRLIAKSSKDAVGNRAPAKFVAGSRRPVAPRRSGSRGSLHDDVRSMAASSTMRLPSQDRALPSRESSRPASRDEDSRRSSIPIPKTNGMDGDQTRPHKMKSTVKKTTRFPVKPSSNPSKVLADITSAVSAKAAEASNRLSKDDDSDVLTSDDAKDDSHMLSAIEESPRQAYKFKRLSTKSPHHGPTLAISPSADRYIMGYDSDKENLPLINEGNMTSSVTPQFTKKISSATKKRLERPSSSNGRTSPRTSLIDREKKVKSVDFSVAIKDFALLSTKTLSKNPSLISNASSVTGPFYDASENLEADGNLTPKASESTLQDESWISPLEKVKIKEKKLEKEPKKGRTSTYAAIVYQPQKDRASTESYDPFKYDNAKTEKKTAVIKVSKPIKSSDELTAQNTAQLKPGSPSTHPECSSPSIDKPVLRVNTPRTVSANALDREIGPPTPPKDKPARDNSFASRQNNLGSSRGLHTSQIDPLTSTANSTNSNRTSLANTKKRDSTARDSLASLPTSTSKSRFNLKTLFHKRSVDTPQLKPKKSKAFISATGSPFPTVNISDIHPVHRPSYSPAKASPTKLSPTKPTTPSSSTLSHPTQLAMSLLESARKEASSPKKERLLELGKVMVDVITQARNAEKAVEEAKMAVKRAERAREACERAVGECGRLVEGVKGL